MTQPDQEPFKFSLQEIQQRTEFSLEPELP
jgi:hypothetical protein